MTELAHENKNHETAAEELEHLEAAQTTESHGTVVHPEGTAGIDAKDETPTADNKVKFWFREPSDEAKKKDPKITKRPDLELVLPLVNQDSLIDSMASDPKVMSWVVEIINGAIVDEARLQVKRADKPVMAQEELDVTKLTLEYLADKPDERKSSGISKEEWQEFEANYISVMPALEGRDVEKVKKVAKIFVARLVPMKTAKPVLQAIQPMLATWYDSLNAEMKEKFTPIYAYLEKRFEEYLAITDENLLADLI